MTYYMVNRHNLKIVELEFTRVTKHFGILPDGRRAALHSSWDDWFPTPEEAKVFEISRREKKMKGSAILADHDEAQYNEALEKLGPQVGSE